MKLGIFVNTDRHLHHLVGIARAAVAKGHTVSVFTMDDGTKLLGAPEYKQLCGTGGISMSFCDHSAKGMGIQTEGLPAEIVCGSQYNNAVMMHDADRVIVL